MLFPMFAAASYLGPVISGRKLLLGRPTFWLMFLGLPASPSFRCTSPGCSACRGGVYTYPEGLGWNWLDLTSTIRRLPVRKWRRWPMPWSMQGEQVLPDTWGCCAL